MTERPSITDELYRKPNDKVPRVLVELKVLSDLPE